MMDYIWHIAFVLQVIAEHKMWAQEKDLCGRIYLSSLGINAQYSGLTANAEGYAQWLEQQDLFKVLTTKSVHAKASNADPAPIIAAVKP